MKKGGFETRPYGLVVGVRKLTPTYDQLAFNPKRRRIAVFLTSASARV